MATPELKSEEPLASALERVRCYLQALAPEAVEPVSALVLRAQEEAFEAAEAICREVKCEYVFTADPKAPSQIIWPWQRIVLAIRAKREGLKVAFCAKEAPEVAPKNMV